MGVLSAYAQGSLPDELGSLANSSGPWALAAFCLALLAPSRPIAALTGGVVLVGLLAGYVVGADVRGFSSSSSLLTFWGLAAVTVGPVLGLAAYEVRTRHPTLGALGGGAMAGALIGEGIYGLVVIADTTSPPYWIGEIAVGVAVLCAVAVRLRRPASIGLAVLTAGVVATAFVAVYRLDLITLF